MATEEKKKSQTEKVSEFLKMIRAEQDVSIKAHMQFSELFKETLLSKLKKVHKRIVQALGWASDVRLKRMELILSEFIELIEALCDSNEEETLDALADMQYVIVGTALTFGLPLEEAFEEVHRSNMTKTPDANDHHEGCNGKGDSYSAPDIKRVLREARKG